ncbi:uncharacterized protein LOC134290136 [Aedes albopictus]|uniref:Reverse transcriptase Ty1/copia-type domain-containing protein n=1 Tax=Aedes albopictus TaxID=7160 RepID=A0ABM1ZHM1_AEDAL
MSLGAGDHRAERVLQAPQPFKPSSHRAAERPRKLAHVEVCGGNVSGPGGAVGSSQADPDADGTLPAVNERKCRRARAKIILLLDPIVLPSCWMHVKDAKTAREVWAKLEAAFEDTGLTRRVTLLRKLITEGDVTITALPPRQSSYPPESKVLRRSGRERAILSKYKDYVFPSKGHPFPPPTGQSDQAGRSGLQRGLQASKHSARKSGDRQTRTEALRIGDASRWQSAMDEEFRALIDNDRWELVQLPADKKAVGCKWLFKTKQDENGNVVRHKARIVAQGFSQRYGTDYDEVFAPSHWWQSRRRFEHC